MPIFWQFVFAFFTVWGIYLTILNFSSNIISYFIKVSKNLLFSQIDFIIMFFISIFVLIFQLYIPMDISSELITVFVFLPTVFFYNTEEKNSIMKSSIKITLLIIFIKVFLKFEIEIKMDENLEWYIAIPYMIWIYFKTVVYSGLYMEILRILSIVLKHLNHSE